MNTDAANDLVDVPSESEKLAISLDELLEEYLVLVDQYQTLRQELANALSKGFMSLAEANFSNQNRIRYGPDYYDERMKARVIVNVEQLQILEAQPAVGVLSDAEPKSQDMPPEDSHRGPKDSSSEDQESEQAKLRDPLMWFGLFAPAALKNAQASFKDVVLNVTGELVSVDRRMKAVEIDVRRTRKRLRKASLG